MDWTVIFLFVLIVVLIWKWKSKPENFPPGPRGLPFVGYLPFLGKYPHETFFKLGKKYGNVIGLRMGSYNVIVLNDWEALKEGLVVQSDVFSDRSQNNILFEAITKYEDIAAANGPGWRERRRFALQHMRDFGMGRSSMEDVVLEEIQKLCQYMKTYHDQTLHISNVFNFSLHNVMWSIVGGKRFDQGDKLLNELSELSHVLTSSLTATNVVIFMPYLKYIFSKSISKVKACAEKIDAFLESEIKDHMATYQDGHHRDFIDAFLDEIFRREKSKDNPELFQVFNLVQVTKDLFVAGIDTSSIVLSWVLLYMISWPSIQKKVQEELDRVIGRQRMPTYRDRLMLPYTEAVISEIYRFSSIAPLSSIRSTSRTTQIFGYTIPKGTLVFPNLWAVHYDPNHWEDPHVFRPERFLNDKLEIQRSKYLIPFAFGGRSCLGEALARVNIFMFFTGLLHQFTFSTPPGTTPPSLEPIMTSTLNPQPFSIHVTQR